MIREEGSKSKSKGPKDLLGGEWRLTASERGYKGHSIVANCGSISKLQTNNAFTKLTPVNLCQQVRRHGGFPEYS
jgi:hypothetical protein